MSRNDPNAKKQGDFSGPTHKRMGVTCGQCGEMWPCDVTELREAYANRGRQLAEAQGELTDGMGKALEVELSLRAENARLQEQVEELETEVGLLDNGNAVWLRVNEKLIRERDGWEALAKVRGEALEENAEAYHATHHRGIAAVDFETCLDAMCKSNHAAIAMTPEEAREG